MLSIGMARLHELYLNAEIDINIVENVERCNDV